MVSKKRQKVHVGDVFAIPLQNGKWSLGQVLEEWMPRIICVALFDGVIEDIHHFDTSSVGSVIALPSVAVAEIANGYWSKIGHAPLQIAPHFGAHKEFESQRYVGATWSSGALVEDFLNAYFGLSTWEPYPGKPGRLKQMLMSSDKNNKGH